MIVIGYQGIGKSTLCQFEKGYIDLESSCFRRINGHRAVDWAETYAQIAEMLSRQGYTVMISSHLAVQKALYKSHEYVVAVFPALDIRDLWVEKLKNRWNNSGEEKDRRAYMDAAYNYDKEIGVLMESPFDKGIIENLDYKLFDILWKKVVLKGR